MVRTVMARTPENDPEAAWGRRADTDEVETQNVTSTGVPPTRTRFVDVNDSNCVPRTVTLQAPVTAALACLADWIRPPSLSYENEDRKLALRTTTDITAGWAWSNPVPTRHLTAESDAHPVIIGTVGPSRGRGLQLADPKLLPITVKRTSPVTGALERRRAVGRPALYESQLREMPTRRFTSMATVVSPVVAEGSLTPTAVSDLHSVEGLAVPTTRERTEES
mmetsp:Transcript_27671/g.63727  ORF Transcript_27671/g.63727 Transcript_27671/m.63727 type:complete len:222 (+) Transcript_27671:313-978(+)